MRPHYLRATLDQIIAANAQFGPLYPEAWSNAMQWTSKDNGWRWRFALVPFSIRDDGQFRRWVWLEWYKAMDCGDHRQVELAPFAE